MYVVSNNLHDWFTPSNPDIGCKRISERKERGLGRSRNLTLSDDAPARYQYRSTVVIASCHWFAAAADDDDAGHSQPVLKGTGLRCCGVDGVMGSCLRARAVFIGQSVRSRNSPCQIPEDISRGKSPQGEKGGFQI